MLDTTTTAPPALKILLTAKPQEWTAVEVTTRRLESELRGRSDEDRGEVCRLLSLRSQEWKDVGDPIADILATRLQKAADKIRTAS